jgi:hypothetical protein
MVTRPSLTVLKTFNEQPSRLNASALICIPSLYNVLKLEEERGYSKGLLGVCGWIQRHTESVLHSLITNTGPAIDDIPSNSCHELEDWRLVGPPRCFANLGANNEADWLLLFNATYPLPTDLPEAEARSEG